MSRTITSTAPKTGVSESFKSRISDHAQPLDLVERDSDEDNDDDGNSDRESSYQSDRDHEAEQDDYSEDEQEKDEVEEELERLVFGDRAGFRSGLRDFDKLQVEEDAAHAGDTGFENVADAELFFADINPDQDPVSASGPLTVKASGDSILRSAHPAVWEDSDDERLQISLATAPRLRKLRISEAEDIINGKEYSKRLRQQFEMLNPAPRWALDAISKPALKKRRLSGEESDSEVDNDADDMDVDENHSTQPLSRLLQDAESLVRSVGSGNGTKRKLRPQTLEIQRLKDIPGTQPSAVTSLAFHHNLPLLLSSGPSSTVYLHQIAIPAPPATPNPLLTSLHIRNSPFSTTSFHPTTSRIFLSSRRRYFHIWNLATGRVEKITNVYGQRHVQQSMERFLLSPNGSYMALLGSTRKGGGVINILNATTLQWSSQVRIESLHGIADFAWWQDSRGMCIVGKNGEVTEWDVEEQRTIARWQDEGAVGTTVLALGGAHDMPDSPIGPDRWIAIGSTGGFVNIYDRRVWLENLPTDANDDDSPQQLIPANPKPTKTMDHLTTPISHLAFAPDAQILCMASRWKRDALRLVHLPSCTVFQNWPNSSTPLGRISSVAWASGDILVDPAQKKAVRKGKVGSEAHSVIAVGNEQGKIRMWEIR